MKRLTDFYRDNFATPTEAAMLTFVVFLLAVLIAILLGMIVVGVWVSPMVIKIPAAIACVAAAVCGRSIWKAFH